MSAIERKAGARRGRGYHRTRPSVLPHLSFTLEGHLFETGLRDLWVTLSGTERIDRIKVTRAASSRSAQSGYPAELVWELRDTTPGPLEAGSAASFWVMWRETASAANFPTVGLGHYERQLESAGAQ